MVLGLSARSKIPAISPRGFHRTRGRYHRARARGRPPSTHPPPPYQRRRARRSHVKKFCNRTRCACGGGGHRERVSEEGGGGEAYLLEGTQASTRTATRHGWEGALIRAAIHVPACTYISPSTAWFCMHATVYVCTHTLSLCWELNQLRSSSIFLSSILIYKLIIKQSQSFIE